MANWLNKTLFSINISLSSGSFLLCKLHLQVVLVICFPYSDKIDLHDIYLNKLFDTFKSLWIHVSLYANLFLLISSSFPFGVFLALAWCSVLQNPCSLRDKVDAWYFSQLFFIIQLVSYFLIFTTKFFVSACTNFCFFFLTVFLIFSQNMHVLGNIPTQLVLSSSPKKWVILPSGCGCKGSVISCRFFLCVLLKAVNFL